jgi:polyisoprenoid-binding protein YceI
MMKIRSSLLVVAVAFAGQAAAEPVKYSVDPAHTYPSFEVDHMGGLSLWRGKFNTTRGSIVLDKEAQTGEVEIEVDTASVNFGHEGMEAHARKEDILDVAKFPTATYKGKLAGFVEGSPTRVEGELTLHGVTQPLELAINSFKCIEHPFHKKEVCGADATARFQRDAFGITYGQGHGFDMDVLLRISVEAKAEDAKAE